MKSEQTKQAFSSLFFFKKKLGILFSQILLISQFHNIIRNPLWFPITIPSSHISTPIFTAYFEAKDFVHRISLSTPNLHFHIDSNEWFSCAKLPIPESPRSWDGSLFYFFTSSFHKLCMLQKTVDYTSSDLRPYSNSVTNITDIIFFVVCSSAVI